MKHNYSIILAIILLGACDSSSESPSQQPDLNSGSYECVSLQTNMGEITLALDKVKAPVSVGNFLSYTNSQFYDGTIFHRVIDGFMIQGGGYSEDIIKKQTNAPIANEADNGLRNSRGSIAAARTSEPHSATSQFYINSVDNNFLDYKEKTIPGWGYAVFGSVVGGMDVVDTISKVPTDQADAILNDVPISNIVVEVAKVISCSDAGQ
ncbi:MAG: peptidylprolyl isomerase [Thiohalomonadales bacterium]